MTFNPRAALRRIGNQEVEHAGLWFDCWAPGDDATREASHVAKTAEIGIPALYPHAFARWEASLIARGIRPRVGIVEGRMVLGLGAESVIETAISLHRTYGVPYIPGSALKGLAAAYARRFLSGEWAADGSAYTTVFGRGGHTGAAGYITFFDALYIPSLSPGDCPLRPDVLTVHHQNYYNSDQPNPPADWDSPIPVPFLSATGRYLLALDGPSAAWVERVFDLLAAALQELGIGAKTSSGYGRMRVERVAGIGQGNADAAPVDPAVAQVDELLKLLNALPPKRVATEIEKFYHQAVALEVGPTQRARIAAAIIAKVREAKREEQTAKRPWYQTVQGWVG
ncbi:type III-B CRISPR module RAMP protein Cmr6 [Candidatus Viridilinea mediisalina]|uniref:Type III-B CRISPR module RAMP protein Cmr6 n=1 Tax=Candidatus Viridilinea mediisalina TaxID=2024553 RepID=A0A2A6RNJ7_9CHLR|nr:type III-B CRISPR module RAMP protein Cmr6 [Candidatus Viridilinea mediisalina]PDW04674.1 type III-B CRISPR module RAMP protein Cmr6 [Candidatus Viridilinea mediisalina]